MSDNKSRNRLIHRYFDDALSAADEIEFASTLESSAHARQQFVDEALLDCGLREVMREADILFFITSEERDAHPATEELASTAPKPRRFSFVVPAAIAAAVLASAAIMALRPAPQEQPAASASVANQAPLTAAVLPTISVGTLVQQKDCTWAPGTSLWRNGDSLPPKTTLSLQSGAAEVALENGVRLLLSGPCKVQLFSELRGKVFSGSITAKVPSSAHGFTLTTPSSQVIDLGTEFGVRVDPGGGSEVHVFKGEVISRWSRSDGKVEGKSLRLCENHAARYGLDKSQTVLITADETRFVRDLAPRLPLEQLPSLPVRENLALWLAADRMIETDENGGVKSWSDLLCDPSQTFQVALQLDPSSRPRLIPDAVHGMPAVRFDGQDDFLVTTPLETTDSQTIFAVIGLTNSEPARGQIINYNGPPHRILRFPSTPGVLQINARRFDDGSFRLAGLVHTGKSQEKWATDGHVRATLAAADSQLQSPLLITYRYDTQANLAGLFVDGQLLDEKTAPWPAGLTSRKVIGRHTYDRSRHLNADIAELIIYNQPLNDDQVAAVTKYLSDRYALLSRLRQEPAK